MKAELRTPDNALLTFEIDNRIYFASPIKDWDGYFVTTCGNIISTKLKENYVMSKVKHDNGYHYVQLCGVNGKRQNIRVHRIVAQAFLATPSKDKKGKLREQVNHLDCNRLNNKVANLEWCSAPENLAHFRLIKTIKDSACANDG